MKKTTVPPSYRELKKQMSKGAKSYHELFVEFSNMQKKYVTEIGALTTRLQNAEASNQSFGGSYDALKKTAEAFANDKERDARTIAALTELLHKAIASNERLASAHDKTSTRQAGAIL